MYAQVVRAWSPRLTRLQAPLGETELVDWTVITRTCRAARSALLRAHGVLPRMTRRSWAFEAAIAIAVLAYELSRLGRLDEGTAVGIAGGQAVPHAVVLIVVVLSSVPLVLRRRFPLAVFTTVIAAGLLYHAVGGVQPTLAAVPGIIAVYSALIYSPYRVAGVTLVAATAVVAAFQGFGPLPLIPSTALPILVIVPVGLAFSVVSTWKQRTEAAREEMRGLEAEQRAVTRLAVQEERARLARELHDVVTHNVSMMVIQAGAARMILDSDPGQAREVLLELETSGRAAMSELRHAMGLLTMNTGSVDFADTPDAPGGGAGEDTQHLAHEVGSAELTAADLAPQPSLADVPELAERVRRTSLPIDVTITGTPVPLPPGADLAAYRVVQEALTNTVKHAPGASVQITITYSPDVVTVDVADTGGLPGTAIRPGGGHGLAGLRERLAIYQGTLDTGQRPTGGFRVHAVLPAHSDHAAPEQSAEEGQR
jgi:signal transduction histidine kinase